MPICLIGTEPMSAFSQRSRPIDATGLFWGFVSVLAGFFYGRIYSTFWFDLAGMALAVACGFWQLQKWSFDRRVSQTAVKWCQANYPHLGQTPIVDFIVAYCQVTFCDVSQMTPESLLPHSELGMEVDELLELILHEARIPRMNAEEFPGSTLGEAIQHAIPTSNSA